MLNTYNITLYCVNNSSYCILEENHILFGEELNKTFVQIYFKAILIIDN